MWHTAALYAPHQCGRSAYVCCVTSAGQLGSAPVHVGRLAGTSRNVHVGEEVDVDVEESRPERLALADKINQAFATLHPADRGAYSNREVAQWFASNGQPGEPTISVNYLAMLRSGERDNPTVRHLRALARFFQIPAEYFLEDSEDSSAVHEDLQMVAAMRDADVREIAARAMELDPSMRQWLRDTVAGLPAATNPSRRRGRFRAPSTDDEAGER